MVYGKIYGICALVAAPFTGRVKTEPSSPLNALQRALKRPTMRIKRTRTYECLVWMAPALQGLFDVVAAKSGTVLCPAC